MPLSTLLNRPCTILHQLPSADEDEYGNEIPDESATETVCEVQQRRRDEPEAQGETSETEWLGIFPAGTALRTGDTVSVEGLGELEVFGDAWPARNPRTRQDSHVEATLRMNRGSEDAS